ncbi:MAG: hypothetical protein L0H70_05015, partial [Xanthomonadales bacterium]|nr:hypothetical protein [Xanthomonadales bacterium]
MTAPMSNAEYAIHRGCSDSYVRRLKREQRLVLVDDGRIDAVASDALLASTGDPSRGGHKEDLRDPMTDVGATDISLREAMRRERLAKAQLAELELGEESGAL